MRITNIIINILEGSLTIFTYLLTYLLTDLLISSSYCHMMLLLKD